jgi:pyruvate-formate lyase-activating enzyme
VFCQNWDISWNVTGERVTAGRLAEMMLEIQSWGCHNINVVTPEHVVPQILEALPQAIAGGLRLPIVYNTSSYDSLDSLRLMDGIVDIYMPDFKVWTREHARRHLRRPDYPDVARETVKEMGRQVGPLTFDHGGLARRGVLLRHLVMPGAIDETEAILRWIAEELGPDTYVDLMAQYYPAGLVGKDGERDGYEEIDRPLWHEEFAGAVEIAASLGLRRLDRRSLMRDSGALGPGTGGVGRKGAREKEGTMARRSGPQAILDRAKKIAEEAAKRAEPVTNRVREAAKKAPVPKQAKDVAGRVAKTVEPAAKKAGDVIGQAFKRAQGRTGNRRTTTGSKRSTSSKKK